MTARIESRDRAYCHEGEHEVLKLSVTRQRLDPLMLQCDSCGTNCCESHWDDHECPTCIDCGGEIFWVPETGTRCDDCHEEYVELTAREEAAADLEEYGDRKRDEQKDEHWEREAS